MSRVNLASHTPVAISTHLACTPGDPAGVGPEIILRALEEAPAQDLLLYGEPKFWSLCANNLAARGVLRDSKIGTLRAWSDDTPPPAGSGPWARPIGAPLPIMQPDEWPWGRAQPWCGAWQYAALIKAIDDALVGVAGAIVTAPWHKARLADAGITPTGHTEVLAERTGTPDAVMMLAGDKLRVSLATVHIPLSEVPAALNPELLRRTIEVTTRALQLDYGIDNPKVAVCGLNPHAGEGGVLGHEEHTWIAPLIGSMSAEGFNLSGPWPADTLFPRVVAGLEPCDAVVALYHDQGLIPLKTVHFGEAANITLGMPIIRTSVDHGTAYDIAGAGVADLGSLRTAIEQARLFVARRAQ